MRSITVLLLKQVSFYITPQAAHCFYTSLHHTYELRQAHFPLFSSTVHTPGTVTLYQKLAGQPLIMNFQTTNRHSYSVMRTTDSDITCIQ